MTLLTVLKDLKSKDIKLWVDGDSLQFDAPPGSMSADLEQQITTYKPEIIQILSRSKKQKGIQPVPRDSSLQLSYAQEGVWYLEQLHPGSSSYNMLATWEVAGELDETTFERALKKLTARHESLRTAFQTVNGRPVLVIQPQVVPDFKTVDLSGVAAAEQMQQLELCIKEEKNRPFDLAQAPLLRVRIFQLSETRQILSFAIHHIISDAWSFSLLFREIEAIYAGDKPLPKLPIQYADFAAWQRKKLDDVAGHADAVFWTKQLSDAAPLLELPTDFQRPAVLQYEGDTIRTQISPELTTKLNALNKAENVTPFMVLLSAFKILMQRFSGQDDIVVGTPMVNRNRVEIENLIGFFLNNLALRSDLSGNPTFRELVDRVRNTTLNAYSHQEVPFERVVQLLDPPRDLSYTPIFQVFFNMTTGNMEDDFSLKGTSVKAFTAQNSKSESKFDFTLYLNQLESHIDLRLVFKTSLFKRERMQELLDQYLFLLDQTFTKPDARINSLSILTPQAKPLLPDPAKPLAADWLGPVHEAVTRQAQLSPDKLAVSDPNLSWSYAQLEKRSNQLAHDLIEHGVEPGEVVAIYGYRSAPLVWAWLGILKAGAAFVNLDPAYPAARLQHYLDVSEPVALIQIPAAGDMPENLCTFAKQSKRSISLKAEQQFATYPQMPPVVEIGPDDTAYIAFTSGSTGKPKGVRGRHGPLSHFLPWQVDEFSLGPEDKFSMLSGLSHDPLQRDIFTAFWAGGTLHIPDPRKIGTPHYLANWMGEKQITFSHMTPPMCQILTESTAAGSSLPDLRYVFFVGDKLTKQDMGQLQKIAKNVTGINSYGSTETQRAVGYYLVPPSENEFDLDQPSKAVYPLGQGMPNVQLLVLNRHEQLAGIGESGEIYVRSPHLAGGYLGDASLSAARFLANPFTNDPTDRLYRTGDLGHYRPDGMVEFTGRADRQFKIRGFRVDPGEIEVAISEYPAVKDALVITVTGQTEWTNSLAAYYTTHSAAAVELAELKNLVGGKLPDHMVPATFTHIESVPLTPNGKIDYRALPPPDQQTVEATLFSPPTSETETMLVEIWRELLEIDQVSVNDNFFALGGHSLLAIRLFNRIDETFGKQLPLTSLFQYPSISQLAVLIDFVDLPDFEDQLLVEDKLLIPIQIAQSGSQPPLFCVHGFGGGVVGYGEMARLLGSDQMVYGLQALGHDGLDEPDDNIETMATRYIESIRKIQPEGPYLLSGYCYGGVVAFEIAHQLEQQGELVPFVGIFEGYAPLRGGNRESIFRNPKLIMHWFRNFPFWFSDFLSLGGKQMSRRMRRRLKRIWRRCAATFGRQVAVNPQDVVDDTAELAEHQLELMKIHLQALRRYDPATRTGSVDLFRIRSQALTRTTDSTMGWKKLAKHVNVNMIKGSHNNILEQPHVVSLASAIKKSLEKIAEAKS
ncbi:MAG: amino acid adenylation domain-containing protein [Anaerolineae bacterium]